LAKAPRDRAIMLHVPDLGSPRRNGKVDALLQEFARRLTGILQEDN
jgi:hypothetical protein